MADPGVRNGVGSDGAGLVVRRGCPVCGSAGSPFVSLPYDAEPIAGYLSRFYSGALEQTSLAGERYELVDCASCGLVYQLRIPDEELLDHLYGWAAIHDVEKERSARGLSVRR